MTDSAGDAKRYSLKLLSYRGRSESELRERLGKKGFPDDVVSRTMKFLKQAGYLDDRALAVNLKRQFLSDRLLGYNGAKRFMLKRGLSSEVIDSTLEYDENIEVQNAKKLLGKKFKSIGKDSPVGEKRRLWHFFARRGYSVSTIKKALQDYNITREDEE